MQFIGIIPARYGSARFPGKPLAMIRGKTMIQRVYEQTCKCRSLADVVVATDDQRIAGHVTMFGKAIMTDSSHASGTERCAEAFEILNASGKYTDNDCILNIQGDEPFITPEQIERLVRRMQDPVIQIATLAKRIERRDDVHNPHIVKVVFSASGKALYFSRAPIPYIRTGEQVSVGNDTGLHYKHIGLYGYRARCLNHIAALPSGVLEKAEKLEQLRWLQQDYDIYVEETNEDSVSVDVPEDIDSL